MRKTSGSIVLLLVLALAACAPSTPGASSDRGQPSVVDQSRILRMVARVEAPSFAEPGGASKVAIPLRMFTAGLAAKDSSEVPFPVLAESLPQLNTDTWKVFQDGRMETTYRLRPGLAWHDGRPLTADDFAFALRAFKAESRWVSSPSGDERKSAPFMDEIVALDSHSLVIRWARAYPGATDLLFQPLPRHLLETWVDQDDADAYYGLDYWTTGYVGAGPYRLARWERNAFMEGTAFEGYALGRPKIDRIVLTFSDRPPVTVARLLADDVDMALDRAIEFQEAITLRQEWAARTQGRFLLSPIQLRYVQIQARPAYADPPALLDVRARRALLHAIDRPALAEAMVDDRGMAADMMVPPVVGYYAAADRAIAKYPYDLRRTEQLMVELGFTKGADGVLVSPTAGRFSPELGGLSEGQEAQDTTIVADYLKRAGIDARLNLIPAALRSGPTADEMTATFPALNTNNNSLNPPMLALEKFTSATIGTPANNWRGTNKMGWSTPEYDRLASAFTSTLDSKEGDALLVEMLTMASNELPALPLYFNFSVVAHVGSLHGPEAATPSSTLYYNIHQWEWR